MIGICARNKGHMFASLEQVVFKFRIKASEGSSMVSWFIGASALCGSGNDSGVGADPVKRRYLAHGKDFGGEPRRQGQLNSRDSG